MSRPTAVLATLVLVIAPVAGCSDGGHARSAEPTQSSSPGASPETADDPRDRVEALLERRAAAILAHDIEKFAADLAAGPARAEQLRHFRALVRLPVQSVSFDLGMHDPAVGGHRYRADVDMLVRLRGFDAAPVPTRHRMDFERGPAGWRIVRDHVERSEAAFAPWLLPGVELAVSDRLIVAFDQGSKRHRERFLALAEEARSLVVRDVPSRWTEHVMVLAPSRSATLRHEGFDPVEISNLGGVAYPVRGPGGQVVGSRVVIAPVMLGRADVALRTVLRHEFAHTALAEPRDDSTPVWVTEGVAEYTAHRGDETYYISPAAVAAAREGITQMPPDGLFHRGEWGVSYGLAWFAMQWLADREGEDEPYRLLDAIRVERPADFRDVSAMVERRYGVTTDELAARAGRLIVSTFG